MIGKQVGIFSFFWIAVKIKAAALSQNVTWLCAIGFTMALFIASLAFTTEASFIVSKIAILFASTVSAVVGLFILSRIRYQDQ